MVESWLGKCIETHSECCDSSDERFLPTRLLELRVIDGQRTFRLVDSWSNPSLSDRYVTLSHCWGSGPVEEKLRLLVSTEPQLRNGLPVSTLPKTFREAFEIIERLKIRYLWIDRLCIIQDSSDDLDWRKEASKMQAVYWNSVLSIAALGASDDQDGCFFTRNPAEVAPTVIRLVDNDRGHVSLYRFHEEKDAWEVGFKEGPILSRAWVVQERALAARILYFGRTQVFWECYEARCCETNPGLVRIDGRHKPSTLVRRYPSASYKLLRDKLDNNSRNTERTNTHVQLLNNWASIVGIYSTCSLARSTDKLIALSGLAHHIRNSLLQLHPSFGTYLAGIWKHTLPLSLLWRRKGPTCRPPSYQAPSWSWASIDGGVTFPVFSESAGHYIEMSSAQVVPQGDDPTGAVTDGVLTLLGRLCKSAISPKRDAKDFRDLGYARILSFYAADSGEHMEVGGGGTISFDATSDACDEVYFLPIFGRALNGVAAFEISGLALMEIEGPRNSYRRVGYVWFWIEDGLDAEGPVPKVLSLITPDIVTIK
ncbi:heterokaryon incompatibility protein-domain-containing protein [Xylariales sp. AK1849]|nr:heterokaryon incompatibility protein-domain-containing protein [Xylariales sp. AK1849]